MSAKTNLMLDLTLFGAFLATSNPHLTGNTIHEWLGVSLAGAVLTHLLLHWDWIIKVGKEFFKKLWHRSRLNFVVNLLFFVTMTGSLVSGLMISESVMSALGIQFTVDRSWRTIHTLISDASVIMLGIHFALHLKWVINNLGRYIITPISNLFRRPAAKPNVVAAQPVRVNDNK